MRAHKTHSHRHTQTKRMPCELQSQKASLSVFPLRFCCLLTAHLIHQTLSSWPCNSCYLSVCVCVHMCVRTPPGDTREQTKFIYIYSISLSLYIQYIYRNLSQCKVCSYTHVSTCTSVCCLKAFISWWTMDKKPSCMRKTPHQGTEADPSTAIIMAHLTLQNLIKALHS